MYLTKTKAGQETGRPEHGDHSPLGLNVGCLDGWNVGHIVLGLALGWVGGCAEGCEDEGVDGWYEGCPEGCKNAKNHIAQFIKVSHFFLHFIVIFFPRLLDMKRVHTKL